MQVYSTTTDDELLRQLDHQRYASPVIGELCNRMERSIRLSNEATDATEQLNDQLKDEVKTLQEAVEELDDLLSSIYSKTIDENVRSVRDMDHEDLINILHKVLDSLGSSGRSTCPICEARIL